MAESRGLAERPRSSSLPAPRAPPKLCPHPALRTARECGEAGADRPLPEAPACARRGRAAHPSRNLGGTPPAAHRQGRDALSALCRRAPSHDAPDRADRLGSPHRGKGRLALTGPADWANTIPCLGRSRPVQGTVCPRCTIRAASTSWLSPRTPRLLPGRADPEFLSPAETYPARFASPTIEQTMRHSRGHVPYEHRGGLIAARRRSTGPGSVIHRARARSPEAD